ncbi:MAG: hypothetical protein AB8B78_04710 [Polaribacter sp.]
MKKTATILLLFLSFSLFSQQKTDTLYSKYFEANREIPYLHLNKTTYTFGEEIWLKAYVLNQKNQKLSDFTRNLYCLIYDKKGILKSKKLLYVKNGIAYGNLKIDSTFVDDSYFIKTATNWMKNFKEDFSFTQKITIINNKKTSTSKSTNTNTKYETQILSEGGNAIVNFTNTYGIVVKNENNIGVKIQKGEIIDDNNNTVSKFSTNKFGLGKVKFYYAKDKQYFVKYTINTATIIKNKIPKAEDYGVSLNVENNGTPFVRFMIGTNFTSLKNLSNRKFKLYIHNTNEVLERTILFDESENIYNLVIPKKKLAKGIQIATLFDHNNTPISERVFFNYNKNILEDINIKTSFVSSDSLEISLLKKTKNNDITFLSASILPATTKATNYANTIISQFLLKPYIKGNIQNPSYYFTNIDRKKIIELDLLLQTQGWSKYNWQNIFYSTNNYTYKNENGITINGALNINRKKDSVKVYLISPSNNLLITKKIKGNSFSFENLFLEENSNLAFVAFENNKIKKTKGYIKTNSFNTSAFKVIDNYINAENNLASKTNSYDFANFNRVSLDEIFLKTKISKTKYNPIFNRVSRKNIVVDDNYKGTQNVLFLLRNLGFLPRNYRTFNNTQARASIARELAADDMVSQGMSLETRERFTNTTGINPLNAELNQILPITFGINPTPFVRYRAATSLRKRIYFDDVDISYDPSQLDGVRVDDLTEIHYSDKEIYLYTKDTYTSKNFFNNRVLKHQLKTGYTAYKEYYDPLYDTNSNYFKNYGAIYWNDGIEIAANKNKIIFKTPTLDQKNIILYLEGITSSGKLISIKKKINVDVNLNN